MKSIKRTVLSLICALPLVFTAGCAAEPTPYETNNSESYTVSVRYDANGGFFTTDVSSIVDSFNISGLDSDRDGKAEIALLSPDDQRRGNDAFAATQNGHFLAGWYKNRIESTDSEGNTVYTYSDRWDFESSVLEVDTEGGYSSETPVMTLYAAWIPLFRIDFYSADTGELMESFSFDPTVTTEIALPKWSEESGTIDMFSFPEKNGFTYTNAYYDKNLEAVADGEFLKHNGVIDYATGTAADTVLDVYIEWTEGEWYRIYNAEQFTDNASLNGRYEIMSDLDFSDEIWPTAFMYGNFSGEIIGNGHKFSNISFEQTNTSKVNAGLFGHLTEESAISDLAFENVSFTIKAGTRVTGTSYGLFAGTLSNDADISGVSILDSVLAIDSGCYFGTDDYSIGLVCGMGDHEALDEYSIEYIATGDNPQSLIITADGNSVTVEYAE